MKPLSFRQTSEILEAKVLAYPTNDTLLRVSTDSRDIREGDLFAGIKGDNFDGSAFAVQALHKGALAVLIAEGQECRTPHDKGVLCVPDTREALQKLAAWYRSQFAIPIAGVTGSVGKTTMTRMIAAILVEHFGDVHTTYKNYNGQLGLPLSIFRMEDHHRASVLEMGISEPGEMDRLVTMARPTAAVVTRVCPAHYEFFENLGNLAKEKFQIFSLLGPEDLAVINLDDPQLSRRAESLSCRKVTFGFSQDAGFHPSRPPEVTPDGLLLWMEAGGEEPFRIPTLGRFNAANALGALALTLSIGVPIEAARRGIAQFQPEAMRLQISHLKDNVLLVNDAYNASLESVKGALEVLHYLSRQGRRTIAVLGDMFELGSLSEEHHREVGREAARQGINLVLAVGEASRWTFTELAGGGVTGAWCQDTHEAERLLEEWVRPGDVILLKGSRGMRLERVGQALQKWLEAGRVSEEEVK